MRKEQKAAVYYICAFIIPVLILLLYFAVKGITPFGDSTFLIHDMNAQYVDFYSYLKTVVQGKNNFLYSFSRGLGGDFLSFFAYYLISPFNLIPFLFPDSLIPAAISLEMLMIFGCCGLSCFHSLLYFSERKNPIILLFISAVYSLSGWMVLNAENFQFVQEAAVLPMVVLYCQKAKNGGKILPAMIWLAIAVILNFYIGYMIFIFSFLWLVIPEKNRFNRRLILIFLGAILISSPVWISVIREIGITIKEPETQWYLPKFNFSVLELLRKFLPGKFDHSQYQDRGLPAVYCTVMVVILAVFELLTSGDRRKTAHRCVITGILLISLFFRPLTMIWQGVSTPHWWPYRFSFLLIYTIVLCAAEGSSRFPWYFIPFGLAGLIYNMDVTFTVKLSNSISAESYAAAVTEKRQALSYLDDGDEFFRIEDLSPRSDNDAMHFAYSGITHFDSLANDGVFDFLEKMGFSRNRYTIKYGQGNTAFANSLLGVRYVKDHNIMTENTVPNSAAFFVPDNMPAGLPEFTDPVQFQNDLAAALGCEEPLLTPLDITNDEFDNIECSDGFCWIIDPSQEGKLIYRFEQQDPEDRLYVHAGDQFLVGSLNISGHEVTAAGDHLVPCEMDDEGNSITAEVTSPVFDYPEITFYSENIPLEKDFFRTITDGIRVIKRSSSVLSVSFSPEDHSRLLLVTIPYEKRWTAECGGNKLPVTELLSTFIGVSVPEGAEEVILSYR